VGEPAVDELQYYAEGVVELERCLRLAGREKRGDDPVVDLGVEDRELKAVGDQVIGAGVRAAGD
jgi:hypothetical protein